MSGTITDASSQAFANGTYFVAFNANGVTGPFLWNGSAYTPQTYSGSLNSSGAFSGLSIPSNNYITGSSSGATLWAFTVCPQSSSTCTTTNISVTGATLSVTSLISPPAIAVVANALNQPAAYSDGEITGPYVGFVYFNLTSSVLRACTVSLPCTWATVGGGGGSGTVTSVTIAGTANQITASGTCTVTTTGTCTLSLPNQINLGTDGSAAGALQTSNSAASAHTIWGSAATTSNTINGFATAPTSGHLVSCTTSSTTCTLTDSGVASSSVGTVTSIATTSPITGGTITGTGTLACATCTTNASALTSNVLVKGGGGQAVQTSSITDNGTTITTSEPIIVSALFDGKVPVTVTTVSSCTLGTSSGCNATAYSSGYTFNEEGTAAQAITYTLPTAAAGLQYCVANANNGSAANTGTLELLTSASGQFIIFTDGTLSATGGYVISGGAAADAACVVGVDSTHWLLYVQSGTWAKH